MVVEFEEHKNCITPLVMTCSSYEGGQKETLHVCLMSFSQYAPFQTVSISRLASKLDYCPTVYTSARPERNSKRSRGFITTLS